MHVLNQDVKPFSDTNIFLYWRSQDIPIIDVTDRVFLSDAQIHESSGLLYVLGSSPKIYNFQHPPLIKYLYGLSIYYFGSANYIQLVFGLSLVLLTGTLAYLISSNLLVSFLAPFLLMLDPLFTSMINQSLLDLGMAVWIMILTLALVIYPRNWLLQGLVVGFIAASKFYATAVVIMMAVVFIFFRNHNAKTSFIHSLKVLSVSFVCFLLIYIRLIIDGDNFIQFVIYQLKIAKYWFTHSTSNLAGNSLIMFFSGWYKNWWEPYQWLRTPAWTWVWPISLFSFIYAAYKKLLPLAVVIIPTFIFLALVFQTPFDRYYITVLPFLYIGLLVSSTQLLSTFARRS